MSRRDRGSGDALGLVLMLPASLALVLLVGFLGRRTDTTSQVQIASDAGAQAAARERSVDGAVAAARAAASAALSDREACPQPAVSVDVSGWRAGVVRVTVTCSPAVDDLALLAPRPPTVSATSVATVDPYRALT